MRACQTHTTKQGGGHVSWVDRGVDNDEPFNLISVREKLKQEGDAGARIGGQSNKSSPSEVEGNWTLGTKISVLEAKRLWSESRRTA